MLRVVLEFDDVVTIVVAPHQMGLCATPHPPDVFNGEPHGRMLASAGLRGKRIVPLREAGGARWETHKKFRTVQIRGPGAKPAKSPEELSRAIGCADCSCVKEDQRFLLFFPDFFFFAFLAAALAFFFGLGFFPAGFFPRFTGAFLAAGLRAAVRGCGAAATPGRSEMTNSSSLSSSMISSGSPPSSSSSSK